MSNEELNNKLADFPYVSGYTPSQDDVAQLAKLVSAEELEKLKGPQADSVLSKYAKFVHIKRYLKHLASFSEAEKKAFPGAPSPAAKASTSAAGDDDDIDLFGSDEDDEEAEKAKAERAAKLAEQKKGKPAVIAKSSVVLDVKVWDDETDLKEVETQVRKIEKDGLLWGAAKTVPLAFGVSKLQIVCVVEDAKVSVDWLSEQIEELELVQSTDIAAFQKI